MDESVNIGIIGTSWWTDSMYLPALVDHPRANVLAVCGRDRERGQQLADRWRVPQVYTDYRRMIREQPLQAIIIATPNDTHYPMGMEALQAGLHVLCEKPLALTAAQAAEMASLAESKGVKTMVPFTYRYMPTARYLKELMQHGYIGQPYHLNMRYYTGYGRTQEYLWRFNMDKAGSGALGDIASHFIYLAEWFYGPIRSLSCQLSHMIERPAEDPAGVPYEQGDDSAILSLIFANGAHGVIHATTLAYEDTSFGQTHHMEFHGSQGTLYHFIDWDTIQQVSGAQQGEGRLKVLPVPDRIWGSVRRDTVHNTYRDIFRQEAWMTRAFIDAILDDLPIDPDFQDGARIQRILDAALRSHREGRRVDVM